MTSRSVAELDCHLNWDLKKGALRTYVKDVIKEINKILTNQWLVLPNQLFLCYLYNDPDNADIPKAKEALVEAEKLNDSQFYDTEACRWIIEADKLCMEKEKANLRQKDFKDLIKRYRKFSETQLATIKALHAYCLVGFGPNGYMDASVLYDEANKHTRSENFMFLYLHALLLGKDRRVAEMHSTIAIKEQQLWQRAKDISENNTMVTDSMEYINFLARYAEAALGFNDAKVALDIATKFEIEKYSDEELKLNYKALLKFHKIFRVCRGKNCDFTETIKERMEVLTKRLFSIESAGIQDSQFYHTLALCLQHEAHSSKDASERREKLLQCESRLLKAQKYAAKPGHVHVDLMLLDVLIELGKVTHERIQDKYFSLEKKHRRSKTNVATIKVSLAWHLITKTESLDEGMKLLEETVVSDKFCMGRIHVARKDEIRKRLTDLNRLGYLSWFQHIQDLKKDEEATEMYKKYMSTQSKNDTEIQFVTVQLALLYLKRGQLTDVEELESKISDEAQKLRIELERQLMRLSVEAEFSTENHLRLANIARICPERCIEVCTKLLSKLEVLSGDDSWKPHTREAYELCATISLAIRAHGDDTAKLESEDKINRILQISADAEDNMRKYRLQATRLHLTDLTSFDAVNMRDNLLQTFRTSKRCLDGCVQILFPHSKACFPFAYFSRTKAGPSQPINQFILELKSDRKLFDSCFDQSFKKVESYKEALSRGENKDYLKKRSDSLKKYTNLLRDREYRIFTTEGGWLSHWISVRNQNSHTDVESFVKKLEQNLMEDFEFNEENGLLGGPRNAYELAHRAAEFAEKTRAWFLEAAASLELRRERERQADAYSSDS